MLKSLFSSSVMINQHPVHPNENELIEFELAKTGQQDVLPK